MKKKLSLLCTVLLSFTLQLNAAICSCGNHTEGIYEYFIEEPAGCCEGTPMGYPMEGTYTTYIDDGKGNYIIENREIMTSAAAQLKCCPRDPA